MRMRKLILNRKKTTIMLVSKAREYAKINYQSMNLGGVTLQFSKMIKYLGIWLDEKLKWSTHIKEMEKKCNQMIAQMSVVMKSTCGYATNHRRIMIYGTVGAYLKYGSAIYAKALITKKNEEIINRIHRKMLIIIGKLYRTVSNIPATIICGCFPLKYDSTITAAVYEAKKKTDVGTLLLKKEKIGESILKEYKKKMRKEAIQKWNEEWTKTEKGAWTKILLPEAREHNEVCDFYLSQGLSGGAFGSYLRKMNLSLIHISEPTRPY